MRRQAHHPKIDTWTGRVVASDEVGYGSWAGPLVVCTASAPIGWDDPRIQDSKLLDDQTRERLYAEFLPDPRFTFSVVEVPSHAIDRMGVYSALLYAHTKALKAAAKDLQEPLLGVVDGTLPAHGFDTGFLCLALPKADRSVPECALASIIAKVARDQIMARLDTEFPGYGFGAHKGYGTPPHQKALEELGPCLQHRTSYAPIAKILADRDAGGELKNAWELLDEG